MAGAHVVFLCVYVCLRHARFYWLSSSGIWLHLWFLLSFCTLKGLREVTGIKNSGRLYPKGDRKPTWYLISKIEVDSFANRGLCTWNHQWLSFPCDIPAMSWCKSDGSIWVTLDCDRLMSPWLPEASTTGTSWLFSAVSAYRLCLSLVALMPLRFWCAVVAQNRSRAERKDRQNLITVWSKTDGDRSTQTMMTIAHRTSICSGPVVYRGLQFYVAWCGENVKGIVADLSNYISSNPLIFYLPPTTKPLIFMIIHCNFFIIANISRYATH